MTYGEASEYFKAAMTFRADKWRVEYGDVIFWVTAETKEEAKEKAYLIMKLDLCIHDEQHIEAIKV